MDDFEHDKQEHEGIDELRWELGTHAEKLGPGAQDGAATLSELVDRYMEMLARERAAERARGAWPLVRLT